MQAVIYSNKSQECDRMSTLLQSISGEFHEYFLGEHFDQSAFTSEFGYEATYPQVALGSKHIGSMKETLQYMKSNGIIQ